MFCILQGRVIDWSENNAEKTKFWELVEHDAQFLPFMEEKWLRLYGKRKICLFLCCPSLWPTTGDLEERNKHNEALPWFFTALTCKLRE